LAGRHLQNGGVWADLWLVASLFRLPPKGVWSMRRLFVGIVVISAVSLFAGQAEAKRCCKKRKCCYQSACCQPVTICCQPCDAGIRATQDARQRGGGRFLSTGCYVQIDCFTQNQGSGEIRVSYDPLPVGYQTIIYVNSNAPGGVQGEYYKTDSTGTQVLGPKMSFGGPTVQSATAPGCYPATTPGSHEYRFTVDTLELPTYYVFHFADNLAQPTCTDQKIIHTAHP